MNNADIKALRTEAELAPNEPGSAEMLSLLNRLDKTEAELVSQALQRHELSTQLNKEKEIAAELLTKSNQLQEQLDEARQKWAGWHDRYLQALLETKTEQTDHEATKKERTSALMVYAELNVIKKSRLGFLATLERMRGWHDNTDEQIENALILDKALMEELATI